MDAILPLLSNLGLIFGVIVGLVALATFTSALIKYAQMPKARKQFLRDGYDGKLGNWFHGLFRAGDTPEHRGFVSDRQGKINLRANS